MAMAEDIGLGIHDYVYHSSFKGQASFSPDNASSKEISSLLHMFVWGFSEHGSVWLGSGACWWLWVWKGILGATAESVEEQCCCCTRKCCFDSSTRRRIWGIFTVSITPSISTLVYVVFTPRLLWKAAALKPGRLTIICCTDASVCLFFSFHWIFLVCISTCSCVLGRFFTELLYKSKCLNCGSTVSEDWRNVTIGNSIKVAGK